MNEQFFLLWSLAVPFLVRASTRTRAALLAAAIAVSLAVRFVFVSAGQEYQAVASLPTNAHALLERRMRDAPR